MICDVRLPTTEDIELARADPGFLFGCCGQWTNRQLKRLNNKKKKINILSKEFLKIYAGATPELFACISQAPKIYQVSCLSSDSLINKYRCNIEIRYPS